MRALWTAGIRLANGIATIFQELALSENLSIAENVFLGRELVRAAASVVGGGGGGRDDMAQAGGRDPAKIDDALATARAMIEEKLG